jgi:hypothetical protein
MRCLSLTLLCALVLLPATLAAQSPPRTAGGRLAVRAVAGYSFAYQREFGKEDVLPRPGPEPVSRIPDARAWNVGGKPVLGAEVEYRFTQAFGIRAGVLHRPQAEIESCFAETAWRTDGLTEWVCTRSLVAGSTLWMARFGVVWSPLEQLPLSLSFSPLWVRHAEPFGGASHHWGVTLGTGVEIPLGSPRTALHAGLEDNVVFWRSTPGDLDAKASHVPILRAGLVYRP